MDGMTLGEAAVFIRGDDRPLWNTINGIGRRLAGGLPGLIGGGLSIAIKGASSLTETMNKLDVIFGKSAGIASNAAEEMAAKFGIVKTSFLDVEGTFGMLLQSMGHMSEDASARMSVTLAKVATDASSLYNTSFEQAAFKIESALRGMSRPIASFGIDTQLAAVKLEAFRMGLVKTNRDLTTQEKVAARASLVMKGLGVATGDLEFTQNTFANASRQAWGRVSNALTAFGQSIMPPIERFMGGLNSVLAGVGNWADENRNAFGAWAENVATVFEAGKGMFLEITGAIGEAGARVFAEVATWTEFNAALASGWEWLTGAAKKAVDFVSLVWRQGTNIIAYAGVVATEKVINMGETFGWLLGTAGQFGDYFSKNWVNMIRDGAVGAWTVLGNLATNIKNLFSAVWDYLSSGGKGGFNFTFTPFLEGFQAMTDKLPEIAKPAFTSLQADLDAITGRMNAVEARHVENQAADLAIGKMRDRMPERPKPNKPFLGEEEEEGPKKGGAKSDKASHTDLASFAKSLQEGAFGKGDAAERTAKASETQVGLLGKIATGLIANKVRKIAGEAVGPE